MLRNEDEFREKVTANLLRSQRKRALFTQPGSDCTANIAYSSNRHSGSSSDDYHNGPTEMDANVALLSEFFNEMAAHQSSQQEVLDDEAEEGINAKKEEALLDNFADFFENDLALQNLLDEVKWRTSDGKAAQREALGHERTQKGEDRAKTSGALTGLSYKSGSSETPAELTSEDYTNTAKYIEALMKEASEEESKQQCSTGQGKNCIVREPRDTEHLKSSWDFARHRVQHRASSARAPTAQKDDERHRMEVLELTRREEWLKSEHIQHLAAPEKNARRNQHPPNHLRSPFVPKMQPLHVQERTLPWRPVWEVPVEDAAQDQLETAGSLASRQSPIKHTVMNPQRPSSERPKTAASMGSPRGCITAAQAATFSYNNRRRIQSAACARVRESAPRTPFPFGPYPGDSPASRTSKRCGSMTDSRFNSTTTGSMDNVNAISEVTSSLPMDDTATSMTLPEDGLRETHRTPQAIEKPPPSLLNSVSELSAMRVSNPERSPAVCRQPGEVHHESPTESTERTTKKKRAYRKQRDAKARFARQVQELVSISAVLHSNSESERKAAAEVDCSSFASPTYTSLPKSLFR